MVGRHPLVEYTISCDRAYRITSAREDVWHIIKSVHEDLLVETKQKSLEMV